MSQLHLDPAQIERARESARRIARQVFDQMSPYTTTTVERATLRETVKLMLVVSRM